LVCWCNQISTKPVYIKIKKRKEWLQLMTNKDIFKDAFPQDKQIGGSHYQHYHIQPYEFISKNELTFFQGNIIKYVMRYPYKGGIQDLEKIKHYCDLEIKKMKDTNKKK